MFINLVNQYNMIEWLVLVVMLLSCAVAIILLYKFLSNTLVKIIKKIFADYVTTLEKHQFFRYLQYALLCVYTQFFSNLLTIETFLPRLINNIYIVILAIAMTFTGSFLLVKIINIAGELYKNKQHSLHIPIDLYAQIIKIFITICAAIIIIAYAFQISLISLFTSFGAATAVLTFIFKNSFESTLASLQLTMQDIIAVDDYVRIPSYNIYGKVIEITIAVVKIKNPDGTISTIPTTALLNSVVINNRPVGAKISFSLNFDNNTISVVDKSNLQNNFAALFVHIKSYMATLLNTQKDVTYFIRRLEPTANGIGLEFTLNHSNCNFEQLESIKSQIIDELLLTLPKLGLKLYQLA